MSETGVLPLEGILFELEAKRIFERELGLLQEYAKENNLSFGFINRKAVFRRSISLAPNNLVFGTIPTVVSALKSLGAESDVICYPTALKDHLHRSVQTWSLNELMAYFNQGEPKPMFVRPQSSLKGFTGVVISSEQDFHSFGGISRRSSIVCSEVVEWKSEYRAYVVNNKVRHISYYFGDVSCEPDRIIVESMAQAMANAPGVPLGYTLDIGVLSTGETALIEINDGFSMDSYDCDSLTYGDLVSTRWCQLTTQ